MNQAQLIVRALGAGDGPAAVAVIIWHRRASGTRAWLGLATVGVAVGAVVAWRFAVIGGFVWGWLTDRYGPKRTLDFVLRSWIGIFMLAAVIGIAGLPLWVLYVVAASAGFSLGGVWSADRPFMLRLTPPARVGEFYGLYGMVGRFSAITGPAIWAGITGLTIQTFGLEQRVGQGIAMLALLVLMITSYVILRPVTDTPREWAEKDRWQG